ncbi:MAG: glycosyltransferase family 39 protein [Chloroflexi bacterium]|nr:glycosyltransferase family 39 protein [Chloroflexota bacterium]
MKTETKHRTWKPEWTICLVIFLIMRLNASFLGYQTASGAEPEPLSSGPVNIAARSLLHQDPFSRLFINVWDRWDTSWYLKIAAFGYDPADGTASYLPLYPWLIDSLSKLTGNYLFSALFVSNLAALAVFILFYEVARVEGLPVKEAGVAVLSLALFPSAFFLLAAYTDALFLTLVLASWLAARHKFWFAAGVLGGFASLTRLQGSLLTPVLGLLWLREVAGFQLGRPKTWRSPPAILYKNISWLWVLLPGLAFLGWTFFLDKAGLGPMPQALAGHWGIQTVPPWTGVWLFFNRLLTTPRVFIDYIDLGSLVFIMGLLIIGLRRLDPILSLYAWLNLALFFMRGTPPHLLDSFSRYMLAVFPAFLVMPQIQNRVVRLIVWILSFFVQIFLLMGFLDWRWVA